MTKGLYLFVTSDRPDQYLNPILHCLQHKNLSKIVFLYVENRAGSDNDTSSSARSVRENVESLLSSLAHEGKYKYFTGNMRGTEVDLLQKGYSLDKLASVKEKYALLRARKVSWSDQDIDYFELKDELARIHTTEPDSIFDVTAVSKSYLGDIFAIGVVEGIDNIYTFGLNRSPNFDKPWESLFHELNFRKPGDKKGYDYVNLTKTYIYDKCTKSILVRQPSLVLSLLVAIALLITLIITSFVFGPTNWLVLIISGVATIASLLSFYFIFFPPRR